MLPHILQSKLVSERKTSRGSCRTQGKQTYPCSQKSQHWDAPLALKCEPNHLTILLSEIVHKTRWMPPLCWCQEPSCRKQNAGAVPTVTGRRKAPVRANTPKTQCYHIPGGFLSPVQCLEGAWGRIVVWLWFCLTKHTYCNSSASAI